MESDDLVSDGRKSPFKSPQRGASRRNTDVKGTGDDSSGVGDSGVDAVDGDSVGGGGESRPYASRRRGAAPFNSSSRRSGSRGSSSRGSGDGVNDSGGDGDKTGGSDDVSRPRSRPRQASARSPVRRSRPVPRPVPTLSSSSSVAESVPSAEDVVSEESVSGEQVSDGVADVSGSGASRVSESVSGGDAENVEDAGSAEDLASSSEDSVSSSVVGSVSSSVVDDSEVAEESVDSSGESDDVVPEDDFDAELESMFAEEERFVSEQLAGESSSVGEDDSVAGESRVDGGDDVVGGGDSGESDGGVSGDSSVVSGSSRPGDAEGLPRTSSGKLHPSTRRRIQLEASRSGSAERRSKSPSTERQRARGVSKKSGYDKDRIVEKYARKRRTQWGPVNSERDRNRHHTDVGTVTGRQIQFYRNLNLKYTYDKNRVAELLTPPSDKQETREQRIRRERLIRQAIGGEEALKRNSKLRVTPKQIDDMRFLAMFRYANAKQVGKKNAEREDTARKRLNRLRDRGLVLSNKIYGTKPVYFLSEEGMILAGYNYKTMMKSDINLSSLSHTFGINHLAACLHGANVDVLGFSDAFGDDAWPTKNRRVLTDPGSGRYVMEYGESVVAEYEIQSSLGRRRQNIKGEVYKPKAQADIKVAMDSWTRDLEDLKRVEDREEKRRLLREHVFSSPEMIHEEEWMWALFPHNPPTLMHHVPDLVVKRPRNLDGSPNSIAVELELNLKNNMESYVKTLTAYKNDPYMYREVVWVSPSATIRNKIVKVAKDVGLWETGKIRVVPLYYEHGEWTDNQMWLL